MALKRPRDTRWSSHYGTLINLMHLFPFIIDVLKYIGENGSDDPQMAEAIDLPDIMNRFEFVFVLHLMKKILGIIYELSQVLQRKDQGILNAMNLNVYVAKGRSRHGSEEMINLHHYRVELFYSVIDMQF
ncbi:uncharacterized protein LOC131172969 [Hevea brasiliensis]|uniref:uncharacterized protein LOC131172969 n=1 Tax=Hevea brasiliensis TaxID=3981 RepID=UPI0025E287AC|nr:uncharacterized protein LOC131172969 [Hevea brasiliensis]